MNEGMQGAEEREGCGAVTDRRGNPRVKNEEVESESMDIEGDNQGQIKVEEAGNSVQHRKRRTSSLSPRPANKLQRLTQGMKRELHV